MESVSATLPQEVLDQWDGALLFLISAKGYASLGLKSGAAPHAGGATQPQACAAIAAAMQQTGWI